MTLPGAVAGTSIGGSWVLATTADTTAAALTQYLALNTADPFSVSTVTGSGIGFQDLYQRVAMAMPVLVSAVDKDLPSSVQAALGVILSSAATKAALLTAWPDGEIGQNLAHLQDAMVLSNAASSPAAQLYDDTISLVGDLLTGDVTAAVVAPGTLASFTSGTSTLAQLTQAIASFGGAGGAATALGAAGSALTTADQQYIAANPTAATQIMQGATQAYLTHLYAAAHI